MKLPVEGFLGGKKPVLTAWVQLGIVIPLLLFTVSMVLIGLTGANFPEYRARLLFTLIVLGIGYWLYASVAVFHCALNEKRNTWLGGAMLFLVPFQAYGVIRMLLDNVDAILGLILREAG